MMLTVYLYFSHRCQEEDVLQKLAPIIERYDVTLTDKMKEADYIFSIGDDGHFLHTLRTCKFREDVVFVGISQTEETNFYTTYGIHQLEEVVQTITDHPTLTEHELLKVQIDDSKDLYAINEVSVRSSIIKAIAINVSIDQTPFEHFVGDGIIISTPTGSTGYNHSVGGAVIDPDLDLLQMTKIAPINTNEHKTFQAPLCLSRNRKVTLEVIQDGNDFPIIGIDNEAYPVNTTKHIHVELSNRNVTLLFQTNDAYIHRLKHLFL